jgi:hypothetical protein
MNTRLKQTTNHITFNSLTFYSAGHDNRGTRARARTSNGFYVEVYGGFNDLSDGANTFDARLVNNEGTTCRVPGYPPVLRSVDADEITSMLMIAQTRARPRANNKQKS